MTVRIIEEGLCGRTTAFEDELRLGRKGSAALPMILESQYPLDTAIVMLGTNDCKSVYSLSAATIGKGIELCLDEIQKYRNTSLRAVSCWFRLYRSERIYRNPIKTPNLTKNQ